MLHLTKLCDVDVQGIDTRDYPDFCDAYIADAWIEIDSTEYETTHCPVERKGNKYFRQLTERELEWLNNEQRDFVYAQVWKFLF